MHASPKENISDTQNKILRELNKINIQLLNIQQTLSNNTNEIEELKNFIYSKKSTFKRKLPSPSLEYSILLHIVSRQRAK